MVVTIHTHKCLSVRKQSNVYTTTSVHRVRYVTLIYVSRFMHSLHCFNRFVILIGFVVMLSRFCKPCFAQRVASYARTRTHATAHLPTLDIKEGYQTKVFTERLPELTRKLVTQFDFHVPTQRSLAALVDEVDGGTVRHKSTSKLKFSTPSCHHSKLVYVIIFPCSGYVGCTFVCNFENLKKCPTKLPFSIWPGFSKKNSHPPNTT